MSEMMFAHHFNRLSPEVQRHLLSFSSRTVLANIRLAAGVQHPLFEMATAHAFRKLNIVPESLEPMSIEEIREIFENLSDATCSQVRVFCLHHGCIADDDALCSEAQLYARYVLALMDRLPKLHTLEIWLEVDGRNEFDLSAPVWAFLRRIAGQQPQYSLELTFTSESHISESELAERYAQFSKLLSSILTTLGPGSIKALDLCFPDAPLISLPLISRKMPLKTLKISTGVPMAAGSARWDTFFEACVSSDSLRHTSVRRSNCTQADVDAYITVVIKACSRTLETLALQLYTRAMPRFGLLPRLQHLDIFDTPLGEIDDFEGPRVRSLSAWEGMGAIGVARLLEHPQRFPELQSVTIAAIEIVRESDAPQLDRLRTISDLCLERSIELRLPSIMIGSDVPGDYLVYLHRMRHHLCYGLTVDFRSRRSDQRRMPSTSLDLDNLDYLDLICSKPEESVPVLSVAMLSPAEQAEAFLGTIRSIRNLTAINLDAPSGDVDVPHLVRYIARAITAGRFPALQNFGGSVPCRKDVIPKSVMQQMEKRTFQSLSGQGHRIVTELRAHRPRHGVNARRRVAVSASVAENS